MGVKPQKNGPRTILYSGTILDFMYLEKFGRLGKGEGPVVQACTKKSDVNNTMRPILCDFLE